jgi:hypothetical protein
MTGWSNSAAPRFDVRWDTPFEESRARLAKDEQVIASDICRAMAYFGFDESCARIPPGYPDLGNLILRQQGRIIVFFEEKVFLDDKEGENERPKGYMAVKTARFHPRPTGGFDMELL